MSCLLREYDPLTAEQLLVSAVYSRMAVLIQDSLPKHVRCIYVVHFPLHYMERRRLGRRSFIQRILYFVVQSDRDFKLKLCVWQLGAATGSNRMRFCRRKNVKVSTNTSPRDSNTRML